MLPISAKDTVRFTPPGLDGQSVAPVYLLAVPTIRSRAAFRRELAAEGATFHDDDAMFQGLRDAVGRQFEHDQTTNADLQAVLDRFAAARRAAEEEAKEPAETPPAEGTSEPDRNAAAAEQKALREALAKQVGELESEMIRRDPAFKRMLAERVHYLQIAPLLAAQLFLKGWEGVAVKFRRQADRVADDCLMQIPEDHLTAIGWKVMSMFRPTDAQTKN